MQEVIPLSIIDLLKREIDFDKKVKGEKKLMFRKESRVNVLVDLISQFICDKFRVVVIFWG